MNKPIIPRSIAGISQPNPVEARGNFFKNSFDTADISTNIAPSLSPKILVTGFFIVSKASIIPQRRVNDKLPT